MMVVYNVGFINEDNERDETQLDIEQSNMEDMIVELINLILDLKDEMGIKTITYVECLGEMED